jgi:hypothetical protein
MRQPFNYFEADRDQEDGEKRSRQHASNHGAAQHAAGYGACASGCPQWDASENEGKRRH